MNSSMNYYELLGVSQTASFEEIKLAYKKQMKKWHPDINKSTDAPSMAQKINKAKEILLDEEKRKNYDLILEKEVNDTYSKYTYKNGYSKTYKDISKTTYTSEKVTKWEYLKEYMKYSNDSKVRKVFAYIGVYLETFLCFILKMLIISFAFIANVGSYMILLMFNYLLPILILLIILLVFQYLLDNGNFLTFDNNLLIFTVCSILIYILGLVLPAISNMILSPKVFDFLYNKIDIGLFKKCVGYKE